MKDRFAPAAMLASHRENASPFMRDQAKAFKALSASDQREYLFYMMANMAVARAAEQVLHDLEPPKAVVQ